MVADSGKSTEKFDQSPTEHYRKARRHLVLASAALLTWDLCQIGFGKDQKLSGKIPFTEIPVFIEKQEFIPCVILVATLFFLLRFVAEWCFCDEESKTKVALKVEHHLTLLLSSAAVSIFGLSIFLNQSPIEWFISFEPNKSVFFWSVILVLFVNLLVINIIILSRNIPFVHQEISIQRMVFIFSCFLFPCLLLFLFWYFILDSNIDDLSEDLWLAFISMIIPASAMFIYVFCIDSFQTLGRYIGGKISDKIERGGAPNAL